MGNLGRQQQDPAPVPQSPTCGRRGSIWPIHLSREPVVRRDRHNKVIFDDRTRQVLGREPSGDGFLALNEGLTARIRRGGTSGGAFRGLSQRQHRPAPESRAGRNRYLDVDGITQVPKPPSSDSNSNCTLAAVRRRPAAVSATHRPSALPALG